MKKLVFRTNVRIFGMKRCEEHDFVTLYDNGELIYGKNQFVETDIDGTTCVYEDVKEYKAFITKGGFEF